MSHVDDPSGPLDKLMLDRYAADVAEVKAVDADDPNADLIGFEFNTDDIGPVVVVGTPRWSDGNYVEVRSTDNVDKPVTTTCRAAGLVRNRMHAEADAELIGHAQDAKDALDAD